MRDKEYIERGSIYRRVKTHTNPYGKPTLDYESGVKVLDMIKQEPAADVVSRGVFEQVKWERDMAMQQLEEHGIPFGGEADDVVNVVRCKDCVWWEARTHGSWIGRCENPRNGLVSEYSENDDFCSYGEWKEQT